MWTDPNEVEAHATQQLRNIAALSWVHGVVVMPDVHLGKGATVGCRHRPRRGISKDVHHGVAVAR